MLKRYSIENFSSFRDKNTLDFTAGRTEVHSNHTVEFKKVKLVKSAILYGANASGKSNLIKSIEFARNIILHNLDSVETYKKYFRLDKKKLKHPTTFEFELEINKKFFSYGFSSILSNKEISEEWLYEIGTNKPKLIFTRNNNQINLGKLLKDNNKFQVYKDDMKNQSEQLFLSEIANKELDIEDIKEVEIFNNIYSWFSKKLLILFPDSEFGDKSSISDDNDLLKIFKKYLNEFDTGIVDISSIEEDFEKSLKNFPTDMKKDIESKILKENTKVILSGPNGVLLKIYKDDDNNLKVQKLGLIHNQNLEEIFELKDESDGTKRLFDLIPLIEKFSQNYTIFIDEFERSLHPKLTQKFFELFYKLNDSKTQLIITTHEATLLNLDLVRRDEIWFIKKDKMGASNIYSLNQFNERYDKKIDKAYLLGRYGAIPIFKTFFEIEEMVN